MMGQGVYSSSRVTRFKCRVVFILFWLLLFFCFLFFLSFFLSLFLLYFLLVQQ